MATHLSNASEVDGRSAAIAPSLQVLFETIVMIASDAIIAFDTDQRVILYNHGAHRIFGWAPEEIIGHPHEILIPPEFRTVHRDHVSEFAYSAEYSRRKEHRTHSIFGLRKSGEIFPAEGAISRFELGTGTIFAVILRDITERWRLEQDLRLSEKRLHLALQAAPVVFCNQDAELRHTWHMSSLAPFGEEVLGMTDDELFPPEEAHHLAAIKRKVLATGEASRQVVRTTLAGVQRHFDLAVEPMRDVSGRVTGLTCAAWDVTEKHDDELDNRFLAEAGGILLSARVDLEATLSLLAELAIRDFADWCVIDLVHDQQAHRVRVAHAHPDDAALAETIRQLRLDEDRTYLIADAIDQQDLVLVSDVTADWIRTTSRTPAHRAKMEALGLRSLIRAPLIVRGRLLGALAVFSTRRGRKYNVRDTRLINELTRLAALAIENAQLFRTAERAVAARDEVVRVIAHDLRNPLFSARLGIRALGSLLDPALHGDSVARIDRALAVATRLIDDLLDASSLEAGHPMLTAEPVSAATLVEDAADAITLLATTSSLGVQLEVASDLPQVLADRRRVSQIFSNLLGNALKFTAPGGTVFIGCAPREREVCFWVRDTGSGIPAEVLPHVFDRFWKAERGDRRGVGLGLSIAKGLVEAHGGHIWAESALGVGSSLKFTLPNAS